MKFSIKCALLIQCVNKIVSFLRIIYNSLRNYEKSGFCLTNHTVRAPLSGMTHNGDFSEKNAAQVLLPRFPAPPATLRRAQKRHVILSRNILGSIGCTCTPFTGAASVLSWEA
jgi:hypothetical protein